MMKQHSKLRALTAFVLAASVIFPSLVSAQTITGASASPTRANFCTAIDQIATKISTNISEREAKLAQKRVERDAKFNERGMTSDAKRTAHRDKWDTERDEWYQKLDARGTNDAERAAIAKFKSAIDSAVAARRQAVDGIVSQMRGDIEAAAKMRQTAIDAALATMKADTDAALAKAKEDCANNVAPKTVRTNYVASMKAAREKMHETVTMLEKRKDTLTPIIVTHKASIEKAIADFRIAVDAAHKELKESLAPQETATSSSTAN